MTDAPLKISLDSSLGADVSVVRLEGPVVISHLFAFQTELRRQTAKLIILDLSAAPYMDSSGLGAILNAYVSAQKNERRLVLAGANERITALLQLTKVDNIVKNFPTVDAAVAS
jgi:anti-anti-sigma factor